MKFTAFCILLCLSALAEVNSVRYEHISDCEYRNKSVIYGIDEITFICGEKDRENQIFTKSNETDCSNMHPSFDTRYKWQGTVDFRHCHFPQINRNYFQMFENMHTFNMSNVELETIQMNIFREAKTVIRLDLSRNKLVEIPSHTFFNAQKLKTVDFSLNAINRIDPLAFEGATDLRTLNLSHNNISELQDVRTINLPKLVELDLSYNKFTNFTEHIFDKLSSLERLNVSFNAIGILDIKTFSCLVNLKHLNLKQMNLSRIELGTFSQQRKLVSLDLSENRLTKLDFKLFSPVLPDLQTLILAHNQLKELYDFRSSSLFPNLTSLQIEGNQFNCAYLSYLFEFVSWEKVHPSSDVVNSTVLHNSNILGIACNESTRASSGPENEYIFADGWNARIQSDDTTTIRQLLIFICVALTLFLILFIVANANRIYDQFKMSFKICKRICMYSSSGKIVEFTNEQILIK